MEGVRKEMKGPSIHLDPRALLESMSSERIPEAPQSTSNNGDHSHKCEHCISGDGSPPTESVVEQPAVQQKEMTNREKLRMKLNTQRMMRKSRSTLKNMYEREQK